MLSTCPSCLNQVNHEDSLLQVTCECGATFQAFITAGEITDETGGDIEPQTMQGAVAGEENFSESMAFLQDIQQFGEDLGKPAAQAAPAKGAPPSSGGSPVGLGSAPSPSPTGERPMTSGDSLPGYVIENYLGPISTWGDLSSDAADPLQGAFDALWARAQKLGATGIVGVRWNFSPDGARILVSGTPVKGQKATPS